MPMVSKLPKSKPSRESKLSKSNLACTNGNLGRNPIPTLGKDKEGRATDREARSTRWVCGGWAADRQRWREEKERK